jgi:hypothetical protein
MHINHRAALSQLLSRIAFSLLTTQTRTQRLQSLCDWQVRHRLITIVVFSSSMQSQYSSLQFQSSVPIFSPNIQSQYSVPSSVPVSSLQPPALTTTTTTILAAVFLCAPAHVTDLFSCPSLGRGDRWSCSTEESISGTVQ